MGLSWGTGSWYDDYLQSLHRDAQGGIRTRSCASAGAENISWWCTIHTLHSNLPQPQQVPSSYKPRLIKLTAEKVSVFKDGQTEGCWKQSYCDLDSSQQEKPATIRIAKQELKGDTNPACIAKKPSQLLNLFSLSGSLLNTLNTNEISFFFSINLRPPGSAGQLLP